MNPQPEILWHYTSSDTFGKIITGKTIRLSSVLKSNDSSEGLLSQWCRYADDGQGIAIGFSRQYLESLPETSLKPVKYDHQEHKEAAIDLLRKWCNEKTIRHNGIEYKSRNFSVWSPNHEETLDEQGKGNVYDFIHQLCRANAQRTLLRADIFLIKHNGFREENEFRLLATSLSSTSSDSADAVSPYDISIDPKQSIREVMLGPTSNATKDEINDVLRSHGFDDVVVTTSDIPYHRKK